MDIPYNKEHNLSQDELHEIEMRQDGKEDLSFEPLILHKLWNNEWDTRQVPMERGGHGGGDKRLHDKIFINPDAPDPLRHAAGSRDGAMSILIGIAARRSIEKGEAIDISSLTDLKPKATR